MHSMSYVVYLKMSLEIEKRENNEFNPVALRTAKTPESFGSSECKRVNLNLLLKYEILCLLVGVLYSSDW